MNVVNQYCNKRDGFSNVITFCHVIKFVDISLEIFRLISALFCYKDWS